ncbi:SMI1/KNR4 family protein [Streptomyces sp. NPDC048340]|uniref:SMI1/KNR4 family protein n=1 Tax=Streptomyces sp. NPDC048340 TaxID=3365537 RepID=UPI00371657C5
MNDAYLVRVMSLLGDVRNSHSGPEAWRQIEGELGFGLPGDFKALVDAYSPIKLNQHIYLQHPGATPRWNLGEYIRDTCQAWSAVSWDGDIDGDPRTVLELSEMEFGTARGLTPVASADSGQVVFLARHPRDLSPLVVVDDGDGEFFTYAMSFSEWLYRYLIGEDMSGPNSSYFHPGPVQLESLPMSPDDAVVQWRGPARGM